MKYINADTIFPEELLKEIQRHIPGGLIYIPRPKDAHKKWGENSGAEGLSRSGTTRSASFLLREQPSINLWTNTVYPSIASRKLCIPKRDETIEAMFEQSNVAFWLTYSNYH